MCTRTQDRQGTPARSASKTSLAKVPVILQWNANGIGSKQTELSIFLKTHNVKVAAIQESKLTAKSRSPNIQNYTLVRQDRRLGPGGGLLFFIHNSVSFTRKPLSTMLKNDPHLEELTISIAMDNTAHYQRVHPPGQFLQWTLFTTTRPLTDRHRFISARRLQCSPFTLALWNNRFERQPAGGLSQHFQLCSSEYRFTYKAPWKCQPQFSRCIISINLSHHLVRMAHTTMSSDHLPILIGLQTTATSSPARHRTYINLKKADWTGYRQ